MKRSHKLLLAALILLLALAVILFPRLKFAKDTDGVAELLRRERLNSDYSSVISFTGSCTTGKADNLVLLWFSIRNPDDPDFVVYQAADCRLLRTGGYLVRDFPKVTADTKKISHTIWMGNVVYLVGDPDCRSIVLTQPPASVLSEIALTPDDLPYIYVFTPPYGQSDLNFLDAAGNALR